MERRNFRHSVPGAQHNRADNLQGGAGVRGRLGAADDLPPVRPQHPGGGAFPCFQLFNSRRLGRTDRSERLVPTHILGGLFPLVWLLRTLLARPVVDAVSRERAQLRRDAAASLTEGACTTCVK